MKNSISLFVVAFAMVTFGHAYAGSFSGDKRTCLQPQAQLIRGAAALQQDYRWEFLGPPGRNGVPGIKNGPNNLTAVKLHLIRTSDNRPIAISDAVLLVSADMAPDGMPTISTRVRRLPERDPAIYRLSIGTPTAGNWALRISARLPGLTAPVVKLDP